MNKKEEQKSEATPDWVSRKKLQDALHGNQPLYIANQEVIFDRQMCFFAIRALKDDNIYVKNDALYKDLMYEFRIANNDNFQCLHRHLAFRSSRRNSF